MKFSDKVKVCRNKMGLTQEELSVKLNVSRKTVSAWENGRSYPDIQMLILLSNFFEISIDAFLRDEVRVKIYTSFK
ncbi:HTH-type transcriptional activator BcrR [Lentilactobacillus hilgardii]|uniref:helix-turn-helix domain-containing protein n=1 Tax=Lentilactobacillus hilgardii TaxID=1588 RepID=UPI00019C4FA7|nr:helix-turn-helix transcriptional regulator [Lentilactobacillus hilgardii]EEI20831.1 DNA-binding helix-turn-helix protein [Lentilactobacillus buchneri ATCC 11577]MCT3395087.1 XRE family transcriptional regulator [Lentilactobacillus hilgardii]QIR08185.1 HTH-type transcriptional activator BcrR [Lentilactobacillus hilgardii]